MKAGDDSDAELTPEEEDELYASLEEIRRGNSVDGRALVRELKERRVRLGNPERRMRMQNGESQRL